MFPVIISIAFIAITLMSSTIPRKDYETHDPKLYYGIFRRERGIDDRKTIGIEKPSGTVQPLRRSDIHTDHDYTGREYRKKHFLFRKQRSAETLHDCKSSVRIQTKNGEYLKIMAPASARIDANNEEPKAINRWTPTDEDIYAAEAFGIRKTNELYSIGEPELYCLGMYLGMDNPARYVAIFNKQSKEAKHLAAFAYAALEGSTMLRGKYPNLSLEMPMSRRHAHKTMLHQQCPRRGNPPCPPISLRYRTADGSCNNIREPWWGSAMSTMIRLLPPAYHDGIQDIRRSIHGHPLPSPRDISNFIHEDRDIPQATVTHMLMQWGQFVDHDIVATAQNSGFNGTFPQCCLQNGSGPLSSKFMHPDCLPIIVNPHDSFLGPLGVRCLEFVRSSPAPRENCQFGPREQLSQVTSFLDASMVYSSSTEHSNSIRLFRHGLLQYGKLQSRRPSLPLDEIDSLCQRGFVTTECFRAGDGRLSEQPALLSIHIVFLRLHNRIATELTAINPHWSDEILYQEARRIVSALIQLVTYREYLPVLLGDDIIKIFDLEVTSDGYYNGYNDTVNPNIANAFSTAAYRFGHSLVQSSFVRVDMQHRPVFDNASIHNEFHNRENIHSTGSLDRLLLGLVNQPSQKRDEFITAELTNHLFQTPNFKFGMDLASINIQRGRDHGLPPYTAWRSTCGLSQIDNWDDFERVASSSAARKFREIYSALEDIDLFSAGLAEKPVLGGLIGPTFACIIAQQFRNLRKGDRFWFENPNRETRFTIAQLQQVKKVTLARILCDTTENIETIQPFVFLTPDTLRNNRVSCDSQIIGHLNLREWAETVSMQTTQVAGVPNSVSSLRTPCSANSRYGEFIRQAPMFSPLISKDTDCSYRGELVRVLANCCHTQGQNAPSSSKLNLQFY